MTIKQATALENTANIISSILLSSFKVYKTKNWIEKKLLSLHQITLILISLMNNRTLSHKEKRQSDKYENNQKNSDILHEIFGIFWKELTEE